MENLFPCIIITYIECFRPIFNANNFTYFQGFVLSFMLLGERRKCVTNISKICFFVNKHISSWERFLSKYQWDSKQVTKMVITLIKEQLGEKLLVHGSYLCWVDTTLISKVKGKMLGVQKWISGNSDRSERLMGHHWALVGLICSTGIGEKVITLCWPLLAGLISGHIAPIGFKVGQKGTAEVMNFWDRVCPLISQLQEFLNKADMRVVADAYFSKATFINRMLEMKINVITRMRVDGVGWDDPQTIDSKNKRGRPRTKPKVGKKYKIADLIKNFHLEDVQTFIYGKMKTLQIVTRDLWIRDVTLQKLRVVVIKNANASPVILLSTDLNLLPNQIIEFYAMRFSLEIAIRDLKQNFGLTNYQCTTFMAINRFVSLTLISFSLWRLALLKDFTSDWIYTDDNTAPLSFKRISRAVRKNVIRRIFETSTPDADLQNSQVLKENIIRLVA